ncbi:hypothetical protein [Ancylobacter oerskovii]|uniref:Secreted protein n=1 Tax=Ancylobacter oerskovii TaxID=459519 RepID=A0ABW4YTJ9_9HYPH|nr:hypothetical protein [Ancylobacter oerskovii]MBS7543350.1 hypothetical protein [Ancylobacter oerskovii]
MIKAPGTQGRMRGAVRMAAMAMLLAGSVVPAALPAAAETAITVYPPPGSGLPPDWATPGSPNQDSGTPPSFQQYPFWDRIFGGGGAIFPGYASPAANDSSYQRLALLTGGGAGRVVFAAGMADTSCQPADAPTLTVLSAPRGVNLTTDYGAFTATGNDAGSTYCVGRNIRGSRLVLAGRPPRGGGSVTVRVAWPRVGRNGGTSYTHTVSLPSR